MTLHYFAARQRRRWLARRSFDFFVDSANGSDSNDGKTQGGAFATLGKVETEASSFGSGARVAFKYGSEWSETIDLSALDNVTVGAYGVISDGLPVMRGDAAMGAAWDDSTDRSDANTNTYSQDLAWGASGYPMVWEDGVALTFQSSVANVDANAGSFTVSGGSGVINASTQTYYVHPTGSTNPESDGKTYEYSTLVAPQFGGDDATIKNLWFRRFGSRNGVSVGKRVLFDGCIFEGHTTHDALPDSGEYRNCVGWHDLDDSRENNIGLEFFTNDGTGLTCKWTDCVYVGKEGASQAIVGLGGHTGGTLYDSVTSTGCSLQDARLGLTSMAGTVTITRPHVIRQSIRVDGATLNTITDPWTEGEVAGCIDAGGESLTVDGWRSYGDHQTQGIGNFSSLTFRGSVLVRTGEEFRGRGPTDTGGALDMQGVVFGDDGGANGWNRQADVLSSADSGGNVLYPNVNYAVNSTVYTDLASLQGAGFEANSVDTDPGVNDPANGDFTLNNSVPEGAGLERDPTCQNYTPIPASLAAAENWILGL